MHVIIGIRLHYKRITTFTEYWSGILSVLFNKQNNRCNLKYLVHLNIYVNVFSVTNTGDECFRHAIYENEAMYCVVDTADVSAEEAGVVGDTSPGGFGRPCPWLTNEESDAFCDQAVFCDPDCHHK